MLFTEHQIRKGMRGGCLPFTRSCSVCMFRALEIIISRAALWPDLHLIKSSVLISSVPLSFDVKKDTSVFLLSPPPPEVLIEWLSGLVALCIFQAPTIRPEWIPQVYSLPRLQTRKTWRGRGAARKGEEVEEDGGGKWQPENRWETAKCGGTETQGEASGGRKVPKEWKVS